MYEQRFDPAVPESLRRERTCPVRTPAAYTPPYPSFVARFDDSVAKVVMAYFGLQYPADAASDGRRPAVAQDCLNWIADALGKDNGAIHVDHSEYVDTSGSVNVLTIAYWTQPETHQKWMTAVGDQWMSTERAPEGVGVFLEIVCPGVDRYETLFSASDRREGVGAAAAGLSGEIIEHAYWGGVRDRIPLGQIDEMAPSGEVVLRHVDGIDHVAGVDNMCLIRSGQDWTDAPDEERSMYLDDVEPSLRAGMDFIAGPEGKAIGCFSNRYLTVLESGEPVAKTFGMSWWRSLADLEAWAESHPTHVAIFGAALRYLGALGPAANLKLYHEVSVIPAADQRFEYRNCHRETGLLAVARSQVPA